MKKVSIKGVLIGCIAATAASSIFSLVVFTAVFCHAGKNTNAVFHKHPALFALIVLFSLVCSLFGGYLAARVARHDEMLNGGLISFLAVLVSLFEVLAGKPAVAWNLLILVAIPPCGAFGGYLQLRQKRHRPRPQ